MKERTYPFGKSTLTLVFGDITETSDDAIVSSDDYMLTMGGGVSRSILRKAGESLAIEASKHIPCNLGDVVVTTAGALPAKHVFHAVTIGSGKDEMSSTEILDSVVSHCLSLVDALNINSISFPAIGAGVAGFSYEDVAVKMADAISKDLGARERPLAVSIYLFDRFGQMSPIDYVHFFEEFASRARSLPEPLDTDTKVEQNDITPADAKENAAVVGRRNAAQQLADLTKERDRIENRLAEFKGALEDDERNALEERLDEIHKLRLEALGQRERTSAEGCRMFVSYSHKDAEFRDALRTHLRALERRKIVTAWFDRLITAGTEWQGQIDENLESSEVIALLISADFIESKYCFDIELSRALERHKAGEALVIPILVRPVVWDDMPFAKLQALPTDRKAVSIWENQDLAWVDVAEGIKVAIEEFAKSKSRTSGC